jgi:hypothetical protein
MFHALLALLNECAILSTTHCCFQWIIYSHTSFTCCRCSIHLNCWSFITGCRLGDGLSLSVECRSSMLLCCLQGIVKFMVGFFLVPTSRNLVVYILAQSRVHFSLSCTQPKNPKNAATLKIKLMHVLVDA